MSHEAAAKDSDEVESVADVGSPDDRPIVTVEVGRLVRATVKVEPPFGVAWPSWP